MTKAARERRLCLEDASSGGGIAFGWESCTESEEAMAGRRRGDAGRQQLGACSCVEYLREHVIRTCPRRRAQGVPHVVPPVGRRAPHRRPMHSMAITASEHPPANGKIERASRGRARLELNVCDSVSVWTSAAAVRALARTLASARTVIVPMASVSRAARPREGSRPPTTVRPPQETTTYIEHRRASRRRRG